MHGKAEESKVREKNGGFVSTNSFRGQERLVGPFDETTDGGKRAKKGESATAKNLIEGGVSKLGAKSTLKDYRPA